MSRKTLLCDNWEFSKNPIGTEYSDSLKWSRVDIPHDWLIYDTNNLYETSTGWYRRIMDHKRREGERVSLRFEGVYMDSRVYVNGVLAGEWKYGYSTFEFDITGLLRDGENLIAVRVDHREPNSRWYSGAGIYRRVWLKNYPDCHLTADGVYISASTDGTVTVTAETERPHYIGSAELSLRHTVMDGDTVIAQAERSCCAFDKSRISAAVRRDGCAYTVNTDVVTVNEPILWEPENPKLYTLVTELLRNGEVIETEENRFGFRKAEFTPDKGFFLNGKHIKLHGCCEHHDLGSLGAAVNRTDRKSVV